MARYDHLPIYRAAFDLAVHLEKLVRQFSRYHKYTLGTELRDGSRRILVRIIEASTRFPQTGRPEARDPGKPLTLSRHPSCATCPDRALPHHALLYATSAGPSLGAGEAVSAAREGRPPAGDAGRPQGRFRGWRSRGKMLLNFLRNPQHCLGKPFPYAGLFPDWLGQRMPPMRSFAMM
jgi:hypothetical protein